MRSAGPALATTVDREVEVGLARHEPADSAKSQDEEMSVGCELDLQIGDLARPSRTGKEKLDDLELPEPIRPAARRGRRRIAEPGRLDLEHETITPPCERELDDLVGTGWLTVPSRSDAEGLVQAPEHYRDRRASL